MPEKKKKEEKEEANNGSRWQMDLSCSTQARLVAYSMQPVDYSPLGKTWQATDKFPHAAGEYQSFTLGHITPQLLPFLFFSCLNMMTELWDTATEVTGEPDSDRRENKRHFNNAGVASATEDTQQPSAMSSATSSTACTEWRVVIQYRIIQKQQRMCTVVWKITGQVFIWINSSNHTFVKSCGRWEVEIRAYT